MMSMYVQNEFKDVEFMTAEKKRKVLKHWVAFIESLSEDEARFKARFKGEAPPSYRKFTADIYEHLHLHCGYIANYNRDGFYSTYFMRPESTQTFFDQFDPYRRVSGDYADLNDAMWKVYEKYADKLKAVSDRAAIKRDLAAIVGLMKKHGITTIRDDGTFEWRKA